MVAHSTEEGFTIVESIVAVAVLGLFLTLFFQLYFTSESQRVKVVQQTAAHDIAQSNLRKISAKSLIPSSTTPCQTGIGSENNPLHNPAASGSMIATSETSSPDPKWQGDGTPASGLGKEGLAGTSLEGAGVIQTLIVLYTQGCDATKPAKIISTVTFGTESVVHATFIN